MAKPQSQYATRTLPRIGLVDIETFPNLYYAWRLWEGHALDVLKFSRIVCFSFKWLDGEQVTLALPDFNGNEKRLTKAMWDLCNEADVLIAHNGKAFDFGRMNAQFLKHGFGPPSPSQKVDTMRVSKRVFGFDSNSLENICEFLGLGKKLKTGGYELWKGCIDNDPKAWAKMKKYNAHDVKLLEKLYLTLRPWIPDHPNMNLYMIGSGCPKCGAEDTCIQSRGDYAATTRVYKRYYCKNCRSWLKSVKSTRGSKYANTGV